MLAATKSRLPYALPLLAFASVLTGQRAPDPDATAGQALFQKSCTACHGANAKGGRGPDLTSGRWRSGGSDPEIVRNIIQGIPNTEMPPFPMSRREAESIVAYLRLLGRGAAPEEPAKGDAVAGRDLFFGSAGCSRCHMLGGRGGRLGPDLSTPVTGGRRPVNLRQAILDPDESQRRNYESVEVRLASGETLRGVAKNEDTFSIQIMDDKERLHMLLKSDVKQIDHPRQSMMPKPHLTGAEVDNLLALLAKGAPPASSGGAWKPGADLDVSFSRIRNASSEPQNWLTYWGDFQGTHHSRLDSINTANVRSLGPRWTYQFGAGPVESVPIVVDGLMFVTGPQNNATGLDARTGRPIWRYTRPLPNVAAHCTVMANRGFAILGDRLYMGTLDAHLVALDAKTGSVIWDVAVEDYQKGFSITHAPLAIDGKIIIGITAGECALTGFVDAYDAATGKLLWRHRTIPEKGDPARATWPNDKAADTGGAPTWTTGTYDAETDTLFWTTGNPSPDYDGSVRAGANLYSCSVLALDPSTGRRKWYFQFSPHDTHDWDANETPMLVNVPFRGRTRKLLIQANRNAFYYVLDRENGQFLGGKAFAHQTWSTGLDDAGHPVVKPGMDPTPEGVYVCPDAQGATNFAAPSFDPKTGLFFVAVREACAVYSSKTREPVPGAGYTGTGQRLDEAVGAHGAIRALDPTTGDTRWNFPIQEGSSAAGVLSTAGGLVFAAGSDGNLIGLEAATGKLLWRYQTGERIRSSPMAFAVDGVEYIAVSSGSVLFAFALPPN
jgi:alcohol dehydrogenase (cytochrome c)